MFEHILLEPEHLELLVTLVEAVRNTPRSQRQPFLFAETFGGSSITHPGLPEEGLQAYKGDIDILAREGLLAITTPSEYYHIIDVTPLGFKYYEHIKQKEDKPAQNIEDTVLRYLDAEAFQKKYQLAYEKWSSAARLLAASDSERQFTTIGHLVREAMQEYATALVEKYRPLNVNSDKTKIVDRLRGVLNLQAAELGKTTAPFLDALLSYWGTLSDLVQRQEHGAQKEGKSLVWEDARRVVFQTAVVMFEIDRTLSLSH